MSNFIMISMMTLFFTGLFAGVLFSYLTKIHDQKTKSTDKSIWNKVIIFTNSRISESNIKHYIPQYNKWIHFLFAFICYLICYNIVEQYPLEYRALTSMIALLFPWIILQFVKYKTTRDMEKQIVDFMISFKTYYILNKDIFMAFEAVEDSLEKPLRNTVSLLNKQRKIKVEQKKCLENFKVNFSDMKMRMFIEQLSLAEITGGNVQSICEKFIEDMSKYEEIEDKDRVDGLFDRYGLYLLLALNIVVINVMLVENLEFIRFVTENILGKSILTLNYIMSIYLVLQLIRNE